MIEKIKVGSSNMNNNNNRNNSNNLKSNNIPAYAKVSLVSIS